MEIELLQSFIEVYDAQSISKAAETQFISQSTMTRRIQALETELKVDLFQRRGVLLEPTDAARTLYKEAGKILRQHNQALIKMNQFKMGRGGSLRVGVSPTVKQEPTMRAVSLMRKNYPDVELSFDCDMNTNVTAFLANRQIDVGITVYGEVRGLEGFACEILSKNTLAALIGRNHRLWNKRPLYAEDLDGEVLYYLNAGTMQSATAVAQFYKDHHVHFAEMIPCRSIAEQMLYLAQGVGVAHTGVIAAEEYYAYRNLVDVVPVERTILDQGFVVALYDKENVLANHFVALLKETW